MAGWFDGLVRWDHHLVTKKCGALGRCTTWTTTWHSGAAILFSWEMRCLIPHSYSKDLLFSPDVFMSPFIDLYSFTKMYFADVVFPVRCQHLRFRQGEVSSKFCWCHHDEGRYPSCGCNLPIKTICSLSTKRWLRCRNPETQRHKKGPLCWKDSGQPPKPPAQRVTSRMSKWKLKANKSLRERSTKAHKRKKFS